VKITFEFDPYEDRDDLATHQNASRFRSAARVALDECRRFLKYHELEPSQRTVLETIRTAVLEELEGVEP
jgi:hypothetical protein